MVSSNANIFFVSIFEDFCFRIRGTRRTKLCTISKCTLGYVVFQMISSAATKAAATASDKWYSEHGREHHLEHEEDVLHIVVPGNRLQDRAQCGEKN